MIELEEYFFRVLALPPNCPFNELERTDPKKKKKKGVGKERSVNRFLIFDHFFFLFCEISLM
jgi:hypothetical protein